MALKRYFIRGNKKRELSSDNSINSDDLKLMCDISLKNFKRVDDIFTEGLSSRNCVAILYNNIINVEKHIQKIVNKINAN